MITVLSPAKTLDYESPVTIRKSSAPLFLQSAASLARLMKKKSSKELSGMMNISPKLAELNVDRFRNWSESSTTEQQRQALLAFKGDVYLGLAAESYNARDFNFAQKNLRILSGLYGRDNSFAKQPRDNVPFSTKGKTHHRYRRIVKSNALPAPLMPATDQKANLSNPVRDSNLSVLLLQVHWKQSNFADNPDVVANPEGTVQHTHVQRERIVS